MVRIIFKMVLFSVIAISGFTFSEQGHVKGKVEYIRTHDISNASWKPPIFWFTLDGVKSAGSCGNWYGNVLFVAESDQMLSIVLATQMAGNEIHVQFNDAVLKNSFCVARYITTGNPPPLK